MGQERLIKSVIAHSLHWRATEECAIDRVTALGWTARYNEMGETMLRVSALEAAALHRAILLLQRQMFYKFRIGREFGRKMAAAALYELLRPGCLYCGGKGQHYQRGEAVRACPYCDGSGLHRYSDVERTVLIGGKYNGRAYEDALDCMRDALQRIVTSTDRRLSGK